MFYRHISSDIKLSLTIPQYATDIFYLIKKNQTWLKQRFNWSDTITSVTDVENFIKLELLKFQQSIGLHTTIFYKNKIAGVAGFTDIYSGIGQLEYWLSEEHADKGIMAASLKELIHVGFSNYTIDTIEMRCTENSCQQLPVELNFEQKCKALSMTGMDALKSHTVYYIERKQFFAHVNRQQHHELCT
ncbi:MAG: hypothetical protein OXD32_00105 [Endozoicomonadaceae bacterium]|nr:hypothetical protein [Endozoicomonadaceae bacterium]MCY4328937.1 hypothetical protein [Endozoicomonadaceae bacterium]